MDRTMKDAIKSNVVLLLNELSLKLAGGRVRVTKLEYQENRLASKRSRIIIEIECEEEG